MSKEHVNTFRLGLFVTATVVLFLLAVYFIGNEQNLFQPTFQIHTIFQNAEGLKPGSNVRYVGIEAGTVQNIVITSDSTIRVEMILRRQMQSYIKKDAIASIGSDGLVGNKIINISPGQSNGAAPLVQDQDVIPSYSRLAAGDMLEVLGKTNENIALFSLQLLRMSEQINSGPGTVNTLLQDPDLAKDLVQTVTNLKYTTLMLREVGAEMKQAVSGLNQGEGLLHDLLYDTTIMADLHLMSGGLQQLMDQKIEPLFDTLQRSTEDIAQASEVLHEMMLGIKAGKGTIGTLLSDPTMENNLKQILSNVNQSTQRFNENMEAMRHHFLFKAYFRKLEKQEKKSLK